MGVYLNDPNAYGLFQEDFSLTYYVDKTEILCELVPLIERSNRWARIDGMTVEPLPPAEHEYGFAERSGD